MKVKLGLIGLFVFLSVRAATACPLCEKNQPKITQGWTHGTGPQSNWDWVIIGIMTTVTLLVLIFSMKYLIRPGETNVDHIKQSILNG